MNVIFIYIYIYAGDYIMLLCRKGTKRVYAMCEEMFLIKMRTRVCYYLKRKLGDGDEQTSSKLERAISYTM